MGLAQEMLEPQNPGQDHHSPKNMSLQHCNKAVEQVETCAFPQAESAEGRSMSPWSVNDYLLIKNERNLRSCHQSDGQITGTTAECFNQINYVRSE